MFDEKSHRIKRLLLLQDILTTLLIFLLTFRAHESLVSTENHGLSAHLAFSLILLIPLSIFLHRFGAYRGLRLVSLTSYFWMVCKAFAFSVSILATLLFFFKITFISPVLVGASAVLSMLALVVIRYGLVWWYFGHSVEKEVNFLKVLIVGSGKRARKLTEIISHDSEWGIDILGYLDTDQTNSNSDTLGSKVIGTIDQIEEILASRVIDEVILAVPRSLLKYMDVIVCACKEQGIRFRFMADVFDLSVARTQLIEMDGIPFLTFDPVAQNEDKLLIKRFLDLVVVLSMMPIIAPVFALIAIAIKLDDGGPIFFVQHRVGLHKRIFPMLKFRSMVIDAEDKLKEVEHLNECKGPNFKIADDPRITRVGRYLRRLSLDELPQLINVLRGQMSLVGPRPMSQRDVEHFDNSIQRKRFCVRPGLTCIWQVSGRSNLSFDEWLELDLRYINDWSLWLDIKLLLKTIPVVIRGHGAV